VIRRLTVVVLLAVTSALAAALAHGSTGARLLRYTDPTGWSVSYPRTFHIESADTGRFGFYEVTIANFAPARGVARWTWPGGGRIDLAPPANPLPANGVAFRVWWFNDGPGELVMAPDSRFPLRLSDFTEPAPYASVRPGRALDISANGQHVGGIVWIGRRASPRSRAALAAIIASLRFGAEQPGTLLDGTWRVLGPAGRYPPGSFTLLPGPGLLCGGIPYTCSTDVVPLYLVHATWPLRSPWRIPCRSRACVQLGSFYAVSWWHIDGWVGRCHLRVDRRRQQFYCANFDARWDRFGRPLRRPRWARATHHLDILQAKVSWDGHVVVQ
jgi:hypothetical protein